MAERIVGKYPVAGDPGYGTIREVRSPYDGRLVGRVAETPVEDVPRHVASAMEGAEAMPAMPPHARAAILAKAAEVLRRDAEEFARLITGEVAKPITDARVEVSRGVLTLTASAEEAKRLAGEVVPLSGAPGGEGKVAWTRREPLGVIAAITPFNFPLNLALHKVAPALAAGNAVILKPAPAAPLTAARLRDALLEAGLPPEAMQNVYGGTDVAQAVVTHPDVAMVTFTGSVAAGRAIQAAAPHKRVTLEMGNAGAVVIEPEADVERALDRCVPAAFAYSGQVCISVQRVFAHRSHFSRIAEEFRKRASTLKAGNPFEEDTRVSSLISDEAAVRVEQWVKDAVSYGATLLFGGARDGRMVAPTVLLNAPATCKVSCQEVFGPVVVLYEYENYEAALDAVDATPYGLQAGVFTRDIGKAMRAVQRLHMGTVLINEAPSYRADIMPYGGVKDSGAGREGPRYAIEEMTEPKLVILHTG